MSASAFYSFIATSSAASQAAAAALEARRQALSPTSLATSSSNSNSSLSSSLTPTPSTPSSSLTSSNGLCGGVQAVGSRKQQVGDTCNPQTFSLHQRPTLLSRATTTLASTIPDPRQQRRQTPRLASSTTFHSLESRPFRPFKSNDGYLYAMKEDLAEWLNSVYADLELNTENFIDELDTGAVLCRHANCVTDMGRNYIKAAAAVPIPKTSNNQNSTTSSNLKDEHFESQLSYKARKTNDSATRHAQAAGSSNNNHSIQANNQPAQAACSSLSPELTAASSFCSPRSPLNIDWFKIKLIQFRHNAKSGTFFARDNICQFIDWCRSLHIIDCLLFETDDLVLRKNDRSFILCLLEVARIGFRVGMSTPLIIQFEQEIDRAIENDAKLEQQQQLENSNQQANDDDAGLRNKAENDSRVKDEAYDELTDSGVNENEQMEEDEDLESKPQVITNDLVSLHERVVELLNMCTCPTQFPMVRISDGKYRVGDKLVIFLRILRNHIMVRVGGGWDTLEHYLDKHDPCRCKLGNQRSQFGSASRLRSQQQSQLHLHQQVPFMNLPLNGNHRKNSSILRHASSNDNYDHSPDGHSSNNDSSLESPYGKVPLATTATSYLPRYQANRSRISSSVSMSWLPTATHNHSNGTNKTTHNHNHIKHHNNINNDQHSADS